VWAGGPFKPSFGLGGAVLAQIPIILKSTSPSPVHFTVVT
jgi:hypothetical protein